jgi:hypothetical protein
MAAAAQASKAKLAKRSKRNAMSDGRRRSWLSPRPLGVRGRGTLKAKILRKIVEKHIKLTIGELACNPCQEATGLQTNDLG